MFDDGAFSEGSFERESWLLGALARVRREAVRLASVLVRTLQLSSRL